MEFSHPEYLVLLLLFFLLWLWARKPRQYIYQPSSHQLKRASIISRIILALPAFLWLLVSLVLVVALAKPVGEKKISYLALEKKILMLSIDVSSSMGSGPDSLLEKSRALALEFVRKREGDAIGVSVYSGWLENSEDYVSGDRPGDAAVLVHPTTSIEQVEAAIRSIETEMLGFFTAIGEGIFVSLVALIEPEAKAALGRRFDKWLLRQSVNSYGEANENLDYAKEVARAVGKQKGKFVILFTDGKYNTGMKPAKALWFAEELGVRVHFIAFRNYTSSDTKVERSYEYEEVIRPVIHTGGLYRESSEIEGIKEIFNEIDKAEKNRVVIEGEPQEEDKRRPLIILAAVLFGLWVAFENLWVKVP